eukprot:4888097-Prymnesium_polylepis.1
MLLHARRRRAARDGRERGVESCILGARNSAKQERAQRGRCGGGRVQAVVEGRERCHCCRVVQRVELALHD